MPYLKAISAPYNMVEFMPTGGINAANIGSYLALKNVVACGGSWMAPSEWIAAKQFDRDPRGDAAGRRDRQRLTRPVKVSS